MFAQRIIVPIVLGMGLFYFGGAAAFSQKLPEADSGSPAMGNRTLTPIYFGAGACAGCHDSAEPLRDDLISTSRKIEMHIWAQSDKHKNATKVLTDARSKEMAKNLGIVGDLTLAEQCVRCHGVYIGPEQEKQVHQASFGKSADRIATGVGCVSCHGAFAEWVEEHVSPLKDWSARTPAQKAELGLNNLWDPVRRAELCSSCHVGSVKEGKLVTHDMFAAGHPPLPSFELATFSAAMPPHWETFAEKASKADRRPLQKAHLENSYHVTPDQIATEQSRLAILGALTAFRESIRLLADEADVAAQGKDDAWPELGVFDCYACHHDLKNDSWRQKRALDTTEAGRSWLVPLRSLKIGRPGPRAWPFTGLSLALNRGKIGEPKQNSTALDHDLQGLFGSLNDRPYGSPKEVSKHGKELVAWADIEIKNWSDLPWTRQTSHDILVRLADFAKTQPVDYDSARQLAWILRVTATEAEPSLRGSAELTALVADLNLDLPTGQASIVADFLPAAMQKMGDYDPQKFRAIMQSVHTKLRGQESLSPAAK